MRKQVIDSESEQQHASTEPHNLQDIEHKRKQAKDEKMDEMETKFRQDPLYRGFLNYNKYKAWKLWLEKKSTFD